jgi:CheY-like chemotaxis protein
MPCKHILVIEDDTDLRETLKDLLEMEGFNVVTASNGWEGLRQIEQNGQPCLILLDLMMPMRNGW